MDKFENYNYDEINKLFTKHMQKTISSINSQHKCDRLVSRWYGFGYRALRKI